MNDRRQIWFAWQTSQLDLYIAWWKIFRPAYVISIYHVRHHEAMQNNMEDYFLARVLIREFNHCPLCFSRIKRVENSQMEEERHGSKCFMLWKFISMFLNWKIINKVRWMNWKTVAVFCTSILTLLRYLNFNFIIKVTINGKSLLDE